MQQNACKMTDFEVPKKAAKHVDFTNATRRVIKRDTSRWSIRHVAFEILAGEVHPPNTPKLPNFRMILPCPPCKTISLD
jgi:hypothetical protein